MFTSQQQSVIYSILASTIVCTLFLGFNYLEAQWSGAPGTPPSGNIEAPIHTGGGYQEKAGGSVPAATDRIATGQFIAGDKMRSDEYCDVNGNNCFGPNDVGSGGGVTFPTPPRCDGQDQVLHWNSGWSCVTNTTAGPSFASCSAQTYSSFNPVTPLPAAEHGTIVRGGSNSSYPSPGLYQCLSGNWVEVYPPIQDRNR